MQLEDTIREAMGGDAAAFAVLVERYQKMAVGYAWSVLRDFQQAEDAAQEAFIRAYFDLPGLKEPRAFAAWLRRLVFKQCDRITRRKSHPQQELGEAAALSPDAAEEIAALETAREVHRALEGLSERERESMSLFYINGYTMAEVGEFLDVPVSTVKNRLFSGRKKLRKGMVDLVMDTLRENAPGEKFRENVARVLQGIRSIQWSHETPISICFIGSVLACMEYLKEPVSGAFLMGVSGAAFKIFWQREYSPANCDVLLLGEEPVRRTFRSLGYTYEYCNDPDKNQFTREAFAGRIVASIDRGVPAIASGIVGPPECCVVAGYGRNGDVLYGHSFFQESPADYFRVEDWFPNCYSVIVIGDKTAPLPRREALRQALEFAVWQWRTPRFEAAIVRNEGNPLKSREHSSGAAAYDGFIEALLRDGDWHGAAPERVKWMSCPVCNDGIFLMPQKRNFAAAFLRETADAAPAAKALLLDAAEKYSLVAREWEKLWEGLPYSESPEADLMKLADPAYRRRLADGIGRAKAIEEAGVQYLEKALESM